MNILIDNKDLQEVYGITILDYTAALGFPSEREDEVEWANKSGVDKNLENIRYEDREFVLKCIIEAENEVEAYYLVKTLVDYMFEKRVFVLSLRDTSRGIRESFICERSGTIIPSINVRLQNSLYVFKIGLKDINPNALRFQTEIVEGAVTISYEKGQKAPIYWGDGSHDYVNQSGVFTKSDYLIDGPVDIFIDVDKTDADIIEIIAAFSGTPLSVEINTDVTFTDESTGNPVIWAWLFGDGNGSALQNPVYAYPIIGIYDVALQVFNSESGNALLTKLNYITVTLPNIDNDRNGTTFSAYVNKSFTLQYQITENIQLAQDMGVKVWLNNELIITFSRTSGQVLTTNLYLINSLIEITEKSYLKIELNGALTGNVILGLLPAIFNLEDAGIVELNAPMGSIHSLNLKDNSIQESDVNYLLEMAEVSTSAVTGVFDISGGTNAIPTSTEALVKKADYETAANWTYIDNE